MNIFIFKSLHNYSLIHKEIFRARKEMISKEPNISRFVNVFVVTYCKEQTITFKTDKEKQTNVAPGHSLHSFNLKHIKVPIFPNQIIWHFYLPFISLYFWNFITSLREPLDVFSNHVLFQFLEPSSSFLRRITGLVGPTQAWGTRRGSLTSLSLAQNSGQTSTITRFENI